MGIPCPKDELNFLAKLCKTYAISVKNSNALISEQSETRSIQSHMRSMPERPGSPAISSPDHPCAHDMIALVHEMEHLIPNAQETLCKTFDALCTLLSF